MPDAPTPSAVRRYLREFLGDRRDDHERVAMTGKFAGEMLADAAGGAGDQRGF